MSEDHRVNNVRSLEHRLRACEERVRESDHRLSADFRELRTTLELYVRRVELLPLQLVAYGTVGLIMLAVIATLLLTVLKSPV